MKYIQKLLFFGLLFLVILPVRAGAEEKQSCGTDYDAQASAIIKLDPSAPDFYVRAGRIEDAERVRLYFQVLDETNTGDCEFIGEMILSDSFWQKVGRLPQGRSDFGTLFLSVDTPETTQAGASQPSVIMTADAPPCELKVACPVTYKGEVFDLSPKKISLSADTLKVGLLSSLDNDTIKQTIYSVDGKQVYTKKIIEPFNERYVAGGEHTVERTVILSSGQALTDSKTIIKGTLGDPGYWFTSTFTRNSKLLLYLGILLGAFLLGLIWISIARVWHKHRVWRLTHITLNPDKPVVVKSHKYDGSVISVFKEHKKLFFAPFATIILIVFAFSFVLNDFTVDGTSMEPTLHDKSKRLLFLAPAQLGKLNGNGYIPGRGSIVVVQKDENNLFDESSIEQKSYVVKRVIGLPDERIVIKDGIITVFNDENKVGFVPDEVYGWINDTTGSEYIKLDIKLGQNELFIVGDNRDSSVDSRFYGSVKASQIRGRVL